MLKKLAIGFGSFLLLILLAIIVIPFVVDVDKYRPQIVSAVNEQINGKLELGQLKFSLWGQIRVEVGGVKTIHFESPFSIVKPYGTVPTVVESMRRTV